MQEESAEGASFTLPHATEDGVYVCCLRAARRCERVISALAYLSVSVQPTGRAADGDGADLDLDLGRIIPDHPVRPFPAWSGGSVAKDAHADRMSPALAELSSVTVPRAQVRTRVRTLLPWWEVCDSLSVASEWWLQQGLCRTDCGAVGRSRAAALCVDDG